MILSIDQDDNNNNITPYPTLNESRFVNQQGPSTTRCCRWWGPTGKHGMTMVCFDTSKPGHGGYHVTRSEPCPYVVSHDPNIGSATHRTYGTRTWSCFGTRVYFHTRLHFGMNMDIHVIMHAYTKWPFLYIYKLK